MRASRMGLSRQVLERRVAVASPIRCPGVVLIDDGHGTGQVASLRAAGLSASQSATSPARHATARTPIFTGDGKLPTLTSR